jgi:tetratricopeptide (TPR) repeat protein
MKNRLALLVVLAASTVVHAGWMVGSTGELTRSYSPNRFTDEFLDKVPTNDNEIVEGPVDWTATVRQRVRDGEKLLRWTPTEDMDQLERSQKQSEVNQKYRALMKGLPGATVEDQLKVVKVIERRPPTPPNPLPPGASDWRKKQYQRDAEAYEKAVAKYKAQRHCVALVMPWQQDPAELPLKRRVAIQQESTAARTAAIKQWRTQVPEHRVFFYTGDEAVLEWREGQAKSVVGTLKRIDVEQIRPRYDRLYTAPLDCRYVQIEAFLINARFDLPSREQATTPEAENPPPDTAANGLLHMAGTYEKAQRFDLAIREYQKAVDRYPETDAAKTAAGAIKRLPNTE